MKGLEGLKDLVVRFLKGSDTYERSVDNFVRELQKTLISADVNIKVVYDLSKKIREEALSTTPPPGVTRRDWFIKVVYDNLVSIFGGDTLPNVTPHKQPYIIMMIGVQGSGKTTTCGKIANYYKKLGFRPCLIAADTYRAGAYEQLKQIGDRINVKVYREENSNDPVEIARKGVMKAIEDRCNIIIIDTAGRHGYGEEKALLDEMEAIAKVVNPDEIMLVIDAYIGQKAYDLAKRFHERTPIGSIVVTKVDGSGRGGGALSAVIATGAKIKFIGTGEGIDDLEVFNPRRFIGRILGLGDIEGLIDKLRSIEESEKLEKRMKKIISKGEISIPDLYHQLRNIMRLGPLSKILQMIPGISMFTLNEDEVKLSEKTMRKWLHIIDSMTEKEVRDPGLLNRSRMRRIAIGSGTSFEDVKQLVTYYNNINKMLKNIKRRGGPQLMRKIMELDQSNLPFEKSEK
ncbi:MAG: signal recognition particle protein Srp54 [Sulfolobales archaeon]